MSESDLPDTRVPLSALPADQKAVLAGSFGGVATDYERYRPGPPVAALDWLLPEPVERVVDLGAGTGALTRQLIGRATEVAAVEPDARMRAVLAERVPRARVLEGRGESIPVADESAGAVLASSSWHWMEPVTTLSEVARVLVPGGTLGVVWSGPDPEGAFLSEARALLGGASDGPPDAPAGAPTGAFGAAPELATLLTGDAERPASTLSIPSGLPFTTPEQRTFTWEVALTGDDLMGLLGTFSWMITMPEERRRRVVAEARRLLGEIGLGDQATVDVSFRAHAWRSARER